MAQQLSFPREFKKRFTLEELNFFQALIRKVKDLEENPVGLGDFLTALNALTAAADKLPYATGAAAAAFADLTSFARTILDDANAAAVLATLGITAQSTATWQAGTGTTESIVSPAKVAAAITALGGGLVLEDTAVADGTAEHLQVTATSTPSDIKRMVCTFEGIVPEIDGDLLQVTAILADDSELTTASYDLNFFRELGAVFSSGQLTGQTSLPYGNMGTGSGEFFNLHIDMFGQNGSQARKFFLMRYVHYNSTPALDMQYRQVHLITSQGIKGFRIDTDNAGDMIASGIAEMWVQT